MFRRDNPGELAVAESAQTQKRPGDITLEFALLLLLATLWGGSYTFIKLGVATIPPVTLIAARTTIDRKSTRLNSSHLARSRMPSSA